MSDRPSATILPRPSMVWHRANASSVEFYLAGGRHEPITARNVVDDGGGVELAIDTGETFERLIVKLSFISIEILLRVNGCLGW